MDFNVGDPLRVLFATPYVPFPPDFGGARRMYELVRGVGHSSEVRVLSLTDHECNLQPAELEVGPITPVRVPFTARSVTVRERRRLQVRSLASPHSAQRRLYVHPEFQRLLDRSIGTDGVDLVQFEFSQMGAYRVPAGVPTILDIHNVEHELIRRMASSGSTARKLFNTIEHRKFRREEISAWRNATCCVATSRQDAAVVSKYTERDVPVMPNGVDLQFFQPMPPSDSVLGTIVFVGAMRYRPNAEGARFFAERIFPLIRRSVPSASFNVVGADPMPEVAALTSIPGVTMTGTVPDVRPWLEAAEVVVVPLLSGGGTRIKILEAFAAGRALVSTSIGAEGIDVVDREHLLLADDPQGFATSVVELMRDAALRDRLIANGLDLVRQSYQWSVIAGQLSDLHANLVRTAQVGL